METPRLQLGDVNLARTDGGLVVGVEVRLGDRRCNGEATGPASGQAGDSADNLWRVPAEAAVQAISWTLPEGRQVRLNDERVIPVGEVNPEPPDGPPARLGNAAFVGAACPIDPAPLDFV